MKALLSSLLALVILLAGCTGAGPAADPVDPAAPIDPADRPALTSTDDQWAELAVRLRGKAGVYRDEQTGRIEITLDEPQFRPDAERAAAEILGLPLRNVVVREAAYRWGQLHDWYTLLNQHTWEVRAISYSSVDTRVNRIRYGVTSIEGKERLEKIIQRAGVPLAAVIIDLPEGALSEANPLQGCLVESLPRLPQEKPSPYHLEIGRGPLRPDEEFTLAVGGASPHELLRGLDAYLECWDGQNWSPRYGLFSDGGRGEPTAVLYSSNHVIPGIGFDASRPGRFRLPADLKPGWYRIRLNVSGTENGYHKGYQLWTPVEVTP